MIGVETICKYCAHELMHHPKINGSGFHGACQYVYMDGFGAWTDCSCQVYEGVMPGVARQS